MPAEARALRIGIGGPVGTGKSSLIATLCRALASEYEIGVVTNDIYTDEDARFLRSAGVLPVERISAVETGCCPHTAIRDDISANLDAVAELERNVGPLEFVLVESGGDNLTAAFSPALADVQIFVLDCAGGEDVPRKGGPGVARADLLVINKVDLAPYVGVDPEAMVRDAAAQRGTRPVFALSLRDADSVAPLLDWVHAQVSLWSSGDLVSVDPGPPAPHGDHGHSDGDHSHEHGDHSHAHSDHEHSDHEPAHSHPHSH